MQKQFSQDREVARIKILDRRKKTYYGHRSLEEWNDWKTALLTPRETLTLHQQSYPIVSVLGVGEQAAVYAIETELGLKAAKLYRTSQRGKTVADEAALLTDMRKEGIPVIEVEDSDPVSGVILFTYHEGLRVSDLLVNFDRYEFTPSERQEIELQIRDLNVMATQYFRRRGLNHFPVSFNEIFDIHLRKVFLIDSG